MDEYSDLNSLFMRIWLDQFICKAIQTAEPRRNFHRHTRALLCDWSTGHFKHHPRGRQKSHKYRVRQGHLRIDGNHQEGPTAGKVLPISTLIFKIGTGASVICTGCFYAFLC